MDFRKRVSLALTVLTHKNGGSQFVRLTEKELKALSRTVSTWGDEKVVYPPTNFEAMVKYGYRRNELIYACIAKTAATAAQVELKVYDKKTGNVFADHPLKQLIQRPNKYMSEYDFWAAVVVYQKLSGRAAFEKEYDNAGRIINLWPLRPDWLRPVPSTREFVLHYEYSPPGTPPAILGVDAVVDFKLFDPIDMYHSWPPVAVASRIGDIDNVSTDHIKRIFDKGAIPPILLTTNVKLTENEIDEIVARWVSRYGGSEKWTAPGILDVDAKVQKLGFDFNELGYSVLDERNEARICMVLDVPPIVIGARVGLNRSTITNYREARQSWWEDTLIPMYENHKDVIMNQLVPDYGDDVIVEWDYGGVFALQEENTQKWSRASDALSKGAITVNEFRAEVGLQSLGPAGDVLLRTLAITEIPVTPPKPIQVGGKGFKAGRSASSVSEVPDEILRDHYEDVLTGAVAIQLAERQKAFIEAVGKIKPE